MSLYLSSGRDLTKWIGSGKVYRNVPDFVSDELLRRTKLANVPGAVLIPAHTASPIDLVQISLQDISEEFQLKPAAERFLSNIASHPLSILNELPIPSATYLNQLNAASGQAMLDNKLSIEIVGIRNGQHVLVPFEALGYWSYLSKAIEAQRRWKQALIWLKGHELQSPSFATLAQAVFSLLSQVFWIDSIAGISSSIMMTDLADFLSDNWLSDGHIDTMLLQLEIRIKKHPDLCNQHIIGCTSLAQSLSSNCFTDMKDDSILYLSTANYFLRTYGAKLAESKDKPLWFIAFSLPGHWIAGKIDPVENIIYWGDSLNKNIPLELENEATHELLRVQELKEILSCYLANHSEDIKDVKLFCDDFKFMESIIVNNNLLNVATSASNDKRNLTSSTKVKLIMEASRGKSSSALSKRALNAAVADGTFIANPQQWDKYIEACRKIDPQFSTPPPKVWPFPGLTQREDPRIGVYLSRILVSSAGGENIGKIAQRMFSKAYNGLSNDEQQAVCNWQVQTHQWRLNHERFQLKLTESMCHIFTSLRQLPSYMLKTFNLAIYLTVRTTTLDYVKVFELRPSALRQRA
ncbi:hypothetical protein BDQ17DRAFT_1331884 [Cyathus striatus]|nr:hypothetical protein BDQ17DRAFT_1331884 [Cyathus striatus]